jgi:hypothetical protein
MFRGIESSELLFFDHQNVGFNHQVLETYHLQMVKQFAGNLPFCSQGDLMIWEQYD